MFSFCMYCCKERCAAIAIGIFSVLFALTSAATIYLTHRLKTDSYVWDLQEDPLIQDRGSSDQPSIETIKLIIYWGLIGICGIAILVAFLGLGTAINKSCCTISFYSFFTLILTVAFLGVGGFLMTVNVASNFHIQNYCNKQDVPKGKAMFTMNFARYFLSYVDEYQLATNQMIKQYMCTPLCPCVQIANVSTVYSHGFNRMDSLNNFEGTYSQFSKCYQDMRRDNRIKEVLSPTLLSLINYLETTQLCTGLCEVPPFPFFQDVRGGQSKQTCEKPIAKLYNMTLGILSLGLLVTGLIIFLAFNAQYGLWRRRFSKPPQQSKDRQMNYMVEDTSKL